MTIEFHPSTVSDLNKAVVYYDSKRKGLGNRLKDEIYNATSQIESFPKKYPVVEKEIRRCFVRKFPYSILFRIKDGGIIRVLAIRHHRLREPYGLQRT